MGGSVFLISFLHLGGFRAQPEVDVPGEAARLELLGLKKKYYK